MLLNYHTLNDEYRYERKKNLELFCTSEWGSGIEFEQQEMHEFAHFGLFVRGTTTNCR